MSRILVIGPARGIALEQWVQEMLERGHEVAIMSPDTPRPALAGLCEATEAGPRLPLVRSIARILRIRRNVRSFRPDVVHGHGALDYGLWAVLSGHPAVLVSCWGSDVLVAPTRSARSRWKVRYALSRASYVTATSQTLLEAARAVVGRRIPGEVLPWGVDTATYRPVEPPVSDTPFVFLSIRALEPLYNVDTIIRAFARVAPRHSSARLVVAGKGSLAHELERLAHDLGIAHAVRFTGWVDQRELPEVYRSAHTYVSIPTSDASAVSNMEAMASGLAIVASDLASTREWIRDEQEGLLVESSSVEETARAMLRLVEDAQLRERLGRAARSRVVEIGERSTLMDRASELYAELAQGISPGGGSAR